MGYDQNEREKSGKRSRKSTQNQSNLGKTRAARFDCYTLHSSIAARSVAKKGKIL